MRSTYFVLLFLAYLRTDPVAKPSQESTVLSKKKQTLEAKRRLYARRVDGTFLQYGVLLSSVGIHDIWMFSMRTVRIHVNVPMVQAHLPRVQAREVCEFAWFC